MDHRAKPKKGKVGAKRPPVRKTPSDPDSKLRDLEKRLAEALGQLQTRGGELAEAREQLTAAHAQVTESHEQQTATSEILRVISASPTDVQPVFDLIARNAVRLCEGQFSAVFRFDGELVHMVAYHGQTSGGARLLQTQYPMAPDPRRTSSRAILTRMVVHVPDLREDSLYPPSHIKETGWHAILAVPLIREGQAVGSINVGRLQPGPFSPGQIALLQTFADQAVIAIENVRLFRELQTSNGELTAALDTQTATSDILRVISRSQTDAQPVFETIVRNAVRLCGAIQGGVYRFDGELVHAIAHEGFTLQQLEDWRRNFPRPVTAPGTINLAIRTRTVVRIDDIEADPSMMSTGTVANLRSRGSRSTLAVPMIRQGDIIGAIALAHRDVAAFSNAHVELLKTFADQAVIAIENVRLFTELQERNREVEQKSRELAAASQHKSEFLANMSHELRTPLNAIIGYSEMLQEEAQDRHQGAFIPDLEKINAAAKHQLSLINDILDLSKVEAGRMELEPTDFDLPGAIDNALTLVRERAGRRGIALASTIDPSVGSIRADERKVKQVLLNLLSNALKFTPEGGRIELRAAIDEGIIEISVTDTGVGIAPEDQEAIFEEFQQVGTADKKVEGTGLGLALCRRFVELHGGRIWVKSQVGQGSTFTFMLPVRREE
jgi:signal transduction histidine kinase